MPPQLCCHSSVLRIPAHTSVHALVCPGYSAIYFLPQYNNWAGVDALQVMVVAPHTDPHYRLLRF